MHDFQIADLETHAVRKTDVQRDVGSAVGGGRKAARARNANILTLRDPPGLFLPHVPPHLLKLHFFFRLHFLAPGVYVSTNDNSHLSTCQRLGP